MLGKQNASQSQESESLQFLLHPTPQGQSELFGPSKNRSAHTTKTLYNVLGLSDGLQKLNDKLKALTSSLAPELINSTLEEVEEAIQTAKVEASSFQAKGASSEVDEAWQKLAVLQESLHAWRQRHPDTSPLRIDNSKLFCFASVCGVHLCACISREGPQKPRRWQKHPHSDCLLSIPRRATFRRNRTTGL